MALAALSLPGELQRSWTARCAASSSSGSRNLEDNARLLYYSGQQMLWGMLAAAAAALAAVFDGRGQPRARVGVRASPPALFGLLLVLAWLAGRPRRSRGRRR